ncbi:uncharacterized protein [Clytia hemisphaerica]|uniref:uncharacterized protein n=1 Tax=Clytia hemisphaerica TaxID=252671 RepID=UPI0034D6A2F0
MGDFTKDIDARCGTQNQWVAVVITCCTIAGTEMLMTIPLNALIVYSLIKERHQKYKSCFYKLVLNIAICDLLTGLIADPMAVNTFAKEAIKKQISLAEVYLIHLSLFITDAVALLTLSILSVERIIAITLPVKHYKGVKKSTEKGLLTSTWVLGLALVSPYFKLGFIRQLFVFSTVNVVVTVLSLAVTVLVYRYKLKTTATTAVNGNDSTIKQQQQHQKSSNTPLSSQFNNSQRYSMADQISIQGAVERASEPDARNKKEEVQEKITSKSPLPTTTVKQNQKTQQKATRTFILMLIVFIATYLPTTFTMIYMNVCTECDCLAIHIMRDVSALSILSSSLLRPLNFILTLKHLRASVFQVFRKSQRRESRVVQR